MSFVARGVGGRGGGELRGAPGPRLGAPVRRLGARFGLLADRLRQWPASWALLLLLVLLGAAVASVRWGAVPMGLGDLVAALGDGSHPLHPVLWQVRLPRVAAGILVGAALGVAGVLMQTVVRNPLADPGLLGVNAGAGLAGLVALVLYPQVAFLTPLFAFLGASVTVLLVLLAAGMSSKGGRRLSSLKIILSGVAFQAVLFSLIALLTFLYADRAPSFVAFTVGSLNGVGASRVGLVVLPLAVGLVLALLGRRPLNLLLLDEGTASGVGLDVVRVRVGASLLAALLAASAVSVAGMVGFVGLVVPNAVRIVSGPDHRTLIPLSALGGAALTLLADLAARTVVAPVELPVGALLALLGGPYFLFILWRRLP